ncbi:MAG: peptidylprolyl isomerase [candidate division KSB1 bacterium]|nr:peptidylprolyl isomerase [candidate division KSB1 bacterium]
MTALLVAAGVFGCADQSRDEGDVLAVIQDRTITAKKFLKVYQQYRQRTGMNVPDNGQFRRQVLYNLVDDEVLITRAIERGYDRDPVGEFERERIETQALLDLYHKKHIAPKVRVEEAELMQLFIRLNTRLKARHLYAPTKRDADSLYALLQAGATFTELARTTFEDPRLRESGGDLGYFTVDEMDPAFEEAAYALQVGEISRPVKTRFGYSIIKVEDIKGNPLLTETEFAKHKPKLRAYWTRRKLLKLTQQHVDSLRRALRVRFYPQTVKALLAKVLAQNTAGSVRQDESWTLDPGLLQQELVTSELGTWTVADFQRYARFTSPKQRKAIRHEEALQDFIAGMVVRAYMLQRAHKEGLHRTERYRDKVAEAWDNYLLQRIESALMDEIVIPEDSVRRVYERAPERFALPKKIRLAEIVVKDKATADRVSWLLKRGEPFAELAKTYSVRPMSAANGGDLGYFTLQELGGFARLVESLQVGEYRGPIRVDSLYMFIRCEDILPGQVRSFEEVRADIEKSLRLMAWHDVRKQKLAEFKKGMKIRAYPKRLRALRPN